MAPPDGPRECTAICIEMGATWLYGHKDATVLTAEDMHRIVASGHGTMRGALHRGRMTAEW